MIDNQFEKSVQSASERMKELHAAAGSPPTHQRGLLPETFEELQISLEELEVASEELRRQNEEMISTRHDLEVERHRYQELFDFAPDAYLVTDANGVITSANRAASTLFAVALNFVKGKPLANFVADYNRTRFREILSTIRQQQPVDMVWSFDVQPRHNQPIPVEIRAGLMHSLPDDVTGIRWLLRDISSRREAEEGKSLLASESSARVQAEQAVARFSQLLNDITDPLFMLDSNHRFTFVNTRCEQLWGKSGEEMIGVNAWNVFPEAIDSYSCVQIKRCIDEQIPLGYETLSPILHRWVRVRCYPTGGGVAVIFQDTGETNEDREKAKRKQARDHEIAETLQRSMLMTPVAQGVERYEIATVYQAASDDALVGGDFFDAFALGPNRAAIVIGDVTGKGLAAASYTAQIKYAARVFLWETGSPSEALRRLNQFVFDAQSQYPDPESRLVAVTLVLIDSAAGQMSVACAGGEPIVIMRNGGGVETSHAGGMITGVERVSEYDEDYLAFSPGDTLILITDGITEARNGQEFLGAEGLTSICKHLPQELASAQTKATHILSEAKSFAGGSLSDDACVVVAQLKDR